MSLIDKIKAARNKTIKAGTFSFIIRRPTDLEMLEISGKIDQRIMLEKFVVGWDGLTELDIIHGGTGEPVEFSAPLWAEWIADHPEYWDVVTRGIIDSYSEHEKKISKTAKNLKPGS